MNDPASDDLPASPSRRRIFQAAGLAATLPALAGAAAKKPAIARGSLDDKLKAHIKTVVVIYMENRSFNTCSRTSPARRGRWRK